MSKGLHWIRPSGSAVPRRRSAFGHCGARGVCTLLLLLPLGCNSLKRWAEQDFKVGPNYCRPAAPVAETWIDYQNSQVVSTQAQVGTWWSVFGDPTLDELIAMASQQNLTLQTAGVRIMESRARLGIARGNLFPQVQQAVGDFARFNTSNNAANVLPNKDFDFWGGGLNASWELDFWGRFRRAIELEDARLNAEIENYDNVLVILQAEVAAAYIQYRTLQHRLELAQQNVKLQTRTLEIADVQFRNGRVTELDVAQAKQNLAATESAIPQFERGIRQTGNALCVLLGRPPQDLSFELGTGPIPAAPPQILVGIPAELLRRRPDVRRAERLAAAQSAAIGIAESDFYPRIALTGFIGVESEDFSDLFNGASFVGSIGPGFRWNVLNYGRIENNVRVQEAQFYQRVLDYQNTVLTANREVEDAIVAVLEERKRIAALEESAAEGERAVEISTTQYQRGRINFQPVVYMQQLLAERQDQLAVSQGAIAGEVVAVYKALGGGWAARLPQRQVAAIPGGATQELVSPPPEADSGSEETREAIPERGNADPATTSRRRQPLTDATFGTTPRAPSALHLAANAGRGTDPGNMEARTRAEELEGQPSRRAPAAEEESR